MKRAEGGRPDRERRMGAVLIEGWDDLLSMIEGELKAVSAGLSYMAKGEDLPSQARGYTSFLAGITGDLTEGLRYVHEGMLKGDLYRDYPEIPVPDVSSFGKLLLALDFDGRREEGGREAPPRERREYGVERRRRVSEVPEVEREAERGWGRRGPEGLGTRAAQMATKLETGAADAEWLLNQSVGIDSPEKLKEFRDQALPLVQQATDALLIAKANLERVTKHVDYVTERLTEEKGDL